MKLRNGFVSNSSSSSFVIVLTKENHEKVLKEQNPYVQAIINLLAEERSGFGMDLVSIPTWGTAGGDWSESDRFDFHNLDLSEDDYPDDADLPEDLLKDYEEWNPYTAYMVYERAVNETLDLDDILGLEVNFY